MEKLTCRICGHKSKNLYRHICDEHGGKDGAKEYRDEFGLDAIVHPDLQQKVTGAKAKFFGKEYAIVKTDHTSMIPKMDKNYIFQSFTEDVLLDLTEDGCPPVMLTGHAGTGKSSLFMQIAARLGQPCLRVNMNGQTTISDFVGMWTVVGGETVWVDGALPFAMKSGVWLIIDELDFAEPAILSVLNSVLEIGGSLTLKEKGGEIILPHKNFRICSTTNTAGCMSGFRHMYQGTNLLNDAFLDRFRIYVVGFLDATNETELLKKSTTGMTDRFATKIVEVANACRESFEREDLSFCFSTRRLLDWSALLVRHAPRYRNEAPMKSAEVSIYSKISKEDRVVVEGIIQRILRT